MGQFRSLLGQPDVHGDLEEGLVEEAGEVPADAGRCSWFHLIDDHVSVFVQEPVHRLTWNTMRNRMVVTANINIAQLIHSSQL